MIAPTDYSANLRDVMFVLFEQLKIEENALKLEPFSGLDRDTIEQAAGQLARLSADKLGPANAAGDRQGCRYDPETKAVKTPDGWPELFRDYASSGWPAMAGDPEYGGMGFPYVVSNALNEFPMGANCSFYLYGLLLTGAANVIQKYGSDELKQAYLPPMYEGRWGGTMLLTESQAGSDVGASRCSAVKDAAGGFYRLKGDKIFISGAEQDLTENIVHLVLARIEGAPKGTKGLSLFLVPKFRINDDGSLGEGNDIYCTGIEHKMGIKGSATCSLTMGDNDDCHGWILGKEHEGIRLMFNMMNEARMDTGMQGICLGSAAYMNALAYARERVQGSPGGTILMHPDVRRMLLMMKTQAEGGRALLGRAALHATLADHGPEESRALHAGLFALLTPICKGWGSERGFDICSLGIQVFGGYGYCQEYPVEQLARDVRIASIYEGTTGIQALDLVGRKLMGDGGKGLLAYLQMLDERAAAWESSKAVGELVPIWREARQALESTGKHIVGLGRDGFALAALASVPFLHAMGDVVVAWELMEQAAIGEPVLTERMAAAGVQDGDTDRIRAHLEQSGESAFYAGKITGARFFVHSFLQEATAKLKSLETTDPSALEHVFGEE